MKKEYRPMLATLVDQPFDSKDWVYETKWDGFRLVAEVRRGSVKDAHLAGDLGDIDDFANFGMKAMQGAFGGLGIECARRYLLRREIV
jgi:hypothetical protein